jgi:hypothetical protein
MSKKLDRDLSYCSTSARIMSATQDLLFKHMNSENLAVMENSSRIVVNIL